MAFYDLSKQEREQLVTTISNDLLQEFKAGKLKKTIPYFADEDTYIRKSAYLATGRIYADSKKHQSRIIKLLGELLQHDDYKVRQTVINAAGEIGKKDFAAVQSFFDTGLFDQHHSPRNAVIGSIKKMGEVNPKPVLAWAKKYLHHPDKEIRREICHGIELRGRKYPQDILPLLKELQHDKTARVRDTLVHVIGQIAYKKGCLATVIAHLKTWDNAPLVADALEEIIDVHHRYRDFAVLTQEQAKAYIAEHYSQ
ncbi:HEAT repeat domain-containing protein [Pseudoflavitalea sp. X16]|uniref:HEAT repeat domain-containing protein n=1 Tax=Paraflavitalea devenefica TaxID=2716334 RepID=UPI00142431F1|nr:HEAT repeat domain-containing protein [Paraflavitalea devenefica]NII27965.1 HEAT repeat domain-containing protein [Paraflavitalea devenefica]